MEREQTHEQMHEMGLAHKHSHTHAHMETKAVLNRMSKIIGHMESIKTMVENGRDCSEVLVQLAAVKSGLNNTGKLLIQLAAVKSAIAGVSRVIIKDHIDHCIVEAVRENDMESIEELKIAIDKFL